MLLESSVWGRNTIESLIIRPSGGGTFPSPEGHCRCVMFPNGCPYYTARGKICLKNYLSLGLKTCRESNEWILTARPGRTWPGSVCEYGRCSYIECVGRQPVVMTTVTRWVCAICAQLISQQSFTMKLH